MGVNPQIVANIAEISSITENNEAFLQIVLKNNKLMLMNYCYCNHHNSYCCLFSLTVFRWQNTGWLLLWCSPWKLIVPQSFIKKICMKQQRPLWLFYCQQICFIYNVLFKYVVSGRKAFLCFGVVCKTTDFDWTTDSSKTTCLFACIRNR